MDPWVLGIGFWLCANCRFEVLVEGRCGFWVLGFGCAQIAGFRFWSREVPKVIQGGCPWR